MSYSVLFLSFYSAIRLWISRCHRLIKPTRRHICSTSASLSTGTSGFIEIWLQQSNEVSMYVYILMLILNVATETRKILHIRSTLTSFSQRQGCSINSRWCLMTSMLSLQLPAQPPEQHVDTGCLCKWWKCCQDHCSGSGSIFLVCNHWIYSSRRRDILQPCSWRQNQWSPTILTLTNCHVLLNLSWTQTQGCNNIVFKIKRKGMRSCNTYVACRNLH